VIIWWQLSPTQPHRVLQQFGTKMIADEFQNDEGVCGLRAVDWVNPSSALLMCQTSMCLQLMIKDAVTSLNGLGVDAATQLVHALRAHLDANGNPGPSGSSAPRTAAGKPAATPSASNATRARLAHSDSDEGLSEDEEESDEEEEEGDEEEEADEMTSSAKSSTTT